MNIEEIIKKYESEIFKNFDRENFNKIINFLQEENCNYIEDILTDYLDLFVMSYEEFTDKYHKLNNKYNGLFLQYASSNMNLLEEFYTI